MTDAVRKPLSEVLDQALEKLVMIFSKIMKLSLT